MKRIFMFALLCSAVVMGLVSCSSSKNTKVNKEDLLSEWQFESLNKEGEVMNAPGTYEITLKFDEEGRFSGNGGCNGFGGEYTFEEGKLTFTRPMSTMKMCAGRMDIEGAIHQLFPQVDNVSLEGNKLSLKKGEEVLMTWTK